MENKSLTIRNHCYGVHSKMDINMVDDNVVIKTTKSSNKWKKTYTTSIQLTQQELRILVEHLQSLVIN